MIRESSALSRGHKNHPWRIVVKCFAESGFFAKAGVKLDYVNFPKPTGLGSQHQTLIRCPTNEI